MENPIYNIAVFIDYENVYKTLREKHTNLLRLGFFEKLRLYYENDNRRIVKIACYCNFDNADLYESHHQSILQSYGVESIHTSNQGKNYADIQITIDVLNSMYLNNNIDEFVLISNDKDMIPLLNTVRANKRKVSIITTGDEYNSAITYFADEHIEFKKIIEPELEAGKLILDNIAEEKFYKRFCNYIVKLLIKYEEPAAKNTTKGNFRHPQVEYVISRNYPVCYIMDYELANIIHIMTGQGKFMFYTYIFKGKPYTAITPSCFKERFMKNKLFSEKDIVSYDTAVLANIYYIARNKKPDENDDDEKNS